MVHQKTKRGQEAIGRLSTFEGIPHPYDKTKRQVVPAALRVIRLKQNRNYTVLGELADSIGWKHKALLETLEAKRKVKADAFYAKKKAAQKIRSQAEQECAAELNEVNAVLANAGY